MQEDADYLRPMCIMCFTSDPFVAIKVLWKIVELEKMGETQWWGCDICQKMESPMITPIVGVCEEGVD